MPDKATFGSKKIATIAIKMALTESREEEAAKKDYYTKLNVKTAAVDFGGDYLASVRKIIERTTVAAKRENVIRDIHSEEGAVAGAAREALSQIMPKAIGLNVGGKVGIARYNDHISVCVFLGIGLLHLDEVSIGLAHRTIA